MSNTRTHYIMCTVLTIGQNQKKSFKCFYNLPAEVRMMIVDEMEPIDRCRFSQCSTLSSMEAKKSKNFMYSLELLCNDEEDVRITVIYDEDNKSGFNVIFREYNGEKFMKFNTIYSEEFWKTELPGSTDLVQFAAEYFKNILKDNQNIIKELSVHNFLEDKLNDFDFGVQSLNNLEFFYTNKTSSILPVISKMRTSLKGLWIDGDQELENYEISKVSENLWLTDFKLNYEQFIQLSAPTVTIHIGYLTEEDICKIIRNWQNQPTGGKNISYKWNLESSDFDISKLLRLLGAEKRYDPDEEEEELMKIKHGFEKGKEALLARDDDVLTFEALSD